ncbi:hypothetical protein BDQ12DRAFT_134262 [Crucibulum laeve]|uniref:Uncharacterized protein n=1 Tax=Crucibulum laeve TaxID=68775 RepID=A0A5C3M1J8_9AGAR|nr:hypothetical protein BDQ12DRAFT_134262 [Crucibulum laeve]
MAFKFPFTTFFFRVSSCGFHPCLSLLRSSIYILSAFTPASPVLRSASTFPGRLDASCTTNCRDRFHYLHTDDVILGILTVYRLSLLLPRRSGADKRREHGKPVAPQSHGYALRSKSA